jgi:hypothetical protein
MGSNKTGGAAPYAGVALKDNSAMKGGILVALLLACGTAQASEWVSVTTVNHGKQELLVDVSSIRVAGEIRRAWVKYVYAPHSERYSDDVNKWVREAVSRDAFNCREETARDEALIVYNEDGTIDAVPANLYPTPWAPVQPDTLLSDKMRFICAWGKK